MIVFYIFIILSAVAVLGVVREIIQRKRCISDAELKLLRSGHLQNYEKRYRRTVLHLGVCRKCERRLESLNSGQNLEDHLVD